MNRIVRTHYPAAKLPADLREGIDPSAEVAVTVEEVVQSERPSTIDEIYARRRPPFKSAEEILSMVREARDGPNE